MSNHRFAWACLPALVALIGSVDCPSADPLTRKQAFNALDRAVTFFHSNVATHGGFVYRYSSDLKYRQGEGLAYDNRIWVQPPGTPPLGLAFLDAYEATHNPEHLDAARDTAEALVMGQLFSGGWDYSITFDPQLRKEVNYRQPTTKGDPGVAVDRDSPGGWSVWQKRRYKTTRPFLMTTQKPSSTMF